MGKGKIENTLDIFFTPDDVDNNNLFSGFYLQDINAQPKYSLELINDLELLPNDFNLDLALLIASRKSRIWYKAF